MPFNPAYSQAIQEQLVRILAHPAFRNSKRYPNFLRYVVELALKGQTENLKERTIGIDVFERNPDYDTNTDHIVRTTAGEIRKRIAQYYHEPGHESELRISLPSGSYVPEFQWPSPPIAHPSRDIRTQSNRLRRVSLIVAVIAFALVIAGIFWFRKGWTQSRRDSSAPPRHREGGERVPIPECHYARVPRAFLA